MDQLQDHLILEGGLVSAADREACRRWAAGAKRKKKKRRKKLPKASSSRSSSRVHLLSCVVQRQVYGPDSAENLRISTGAVLGADRGVPMPPIMEVFVEVIQLLRDMEQIVASCH